MATLEDPRGPDAQPDRPRPNLLAYPSPTTLRFVVFLAALLSAGAFVGTWLHNELLFDEWLNVAVRCEKQALAQTATLPADQAILARIPAAARCRAAADRRRAAFDFGGAAAAGAAGLVVLYLAPAVVERRRQLRPFGPALKPAADRVAALAAQAGLTRPPTPVLGAATLRDAFSYGTPGRYRIALPRAAAVRWRSQALFDPLVRHELAHVAHRDVTLAWLARSVWYALAPLLALPLGVTLFSSDRSLLPDYVWRTVLLATTVQLVSSALLRSREHDADLRAARAAGDQGAVAALVARTREPGRASRVRRLLANHPSPARRQAVLARPELAAGVTFLDGLTAAFLAALTVPLIVRALVTLFMGRGRTDLATAVAALVAGPLLGGSVGLGLWRAALIQRAVGRPTRPGPAALGVAAGLVLGQVASLAHTGIEELGGVTSPPWLAVVALAGLGATVLAAGLGELWADAAPAMRRARTSWVVALAVNSVLYATVLWMARWLELALDNGGWVLARAWLVTVVASWPVLAAVAVLAGAAAWALSATRPGAGTPGWLLERGDPQPWPVTGHADLARTTTTALAAGLTGAGAIVAFRILAGPAAEAALEQRFYTYVWMGAAAGTSAAITLTLSLPRRGVGAGALAGPLACLTAMTGFVAMNTVLGGRLYAGFITGVTRPPVALGLVLGVLVAPAALLTWERNARVQRIWLTAAALGLACASAVVAGRATLTGFPSSVAAVLPPGPVVPATPDFTVAEAQYYLTVTAPDVARRYTNLQRAVAAIAADPTIDGATRAVRVRTEILGPLRVLLADAEAYQPTTAKTRAVHLACVTALRTATEEFETFAAAFDANDAQTLADAQIKQQQEQRHWQAWQTGLAELEATVASG
jgi:Zn-dependent protease with chaperone function